MQPPNVSQAGSGDVAIACQVVGGGPTAIVFVRGITGDLLSTWEQPLLVRHVEGLATAGRVLMLDSAGRASPTAFARCSRTIRRIPAPESDLAPESGAILVHLAALMRYFMRVPHLSDQVRSPVDLRKRKKSKERESWGAAEVVAPPSSEADGAVEDRAAPAATTPDDRDDRDAAERAEIAEVMYKAAAERAEIAEVMYGAALRRGELAEAMEKAAAERASAAEAIEKAAAERTASLAAREKAAAERDSIANSRDRAAAERDSIANTRDRAAAERGTSAVSRLTVGREAANEDGEDPALERARLEAELQRAHLDALTGAFRREMGRLALRNEIERARRSNGKFVIAFIDVDGLKGVNDRDGHAAGDRVLRTLAATMRANLRSYDPIVRFGGDEFICGISSIDPGEVQHRIGVIDQSLRNATGVGITAGLAELTSNESLDELTAKADAALIEAKRNRVE